jgi:hypothetical protein
LKDYVNGKLLYVEPPPGINPTEFNSEIYKDPVLLKKQIEKISLPLPYVEKVFDY